MSGFAVVALLGVSDAGDTDEVSQEAETFERALELAQEIQDGASGWKAITIIHIEDFPRLMQGASEVGS